MTPKSPEGLANIRAALQTPEYRAKRSALSSGEKNYFFGKPGTNRGKFGTDHPMYGRHFKKKGPCNGINASFYGRRHTLEARVKNSLAHIGKLKGLNNPRWNGGQVPDPYDYTFRDLLKNQVRERDGFTCRLCGKPEKSRHHHVHHIFYNRKDTALDRLITLCVKCHKIVHQQKKIWPPILTAKLTT